jgi:two-component system LytT family response regulator
MRVVVVDDEPLARDGIVMYLAGCGADVEVVAQCGNGIEAVQAIRELSPDLVLLDIAMPGLSGLEVVSRIGADEMPLTIFLTAHDEFAIDAFRVHALDYLLKPINEDDFRASLQRVREALQKNRLHRHTEQLAGLLQSLGGPARDAQQSERILVRSAGHVYFLRPEEIRWIEAERDYVSIHTQTRTHLVRETLSAMERRLADAGFQRIHRSSLVNLEAIRELIANYSGDYRVVLKDDTELKLSRSYRDRLYARLKAD